MTKKTNWLELMEANTRAAQAHFAAQTAKAAHYAQEEISRHANLAHRIFEEQLKTAQAITGARSPQDIAQAVANGATRVSEALVDHTRETASRAQVAFDELRADTEGAARAAGEAAGEAWTTGVAHVTEAARATREAGENLAKQTQEATHAFVERQANSHGVHHRASSEAASKPASKRAGSAKSATAQN
jgi:phenylpyruvate tautomerase PptA (4-oxalocrotonate tautomerase family)